MFRATLLSIVLTLATGANSTLYCALWCHSIEGVAGGCEHQTEPGTAPILAAASDCSLTGTTTLFVGEDGPRNTSASRIQGTVAIATFIVTPSAPSRLSPRETDSPPALAFRPPVLALRI